MGLFNVGDILGKAKEAADAVATAAAEATNAVATAATEATNAVATAATEATKDIKIPDVLSDIKVPEQVTDLFSGPKPEAINPAEQIKRGVTAQDALRIFFFLMAADGELHASELEKFNSECEEFGKDYKEQQEELVADCQARLTASASSISPLVSAMSCVDAVLYAPEELSEDGVTIVPKLLVWNLLAIAYSDENCDDAEREFIRHVSQRMDVSETTVLDMESYVYAINDVEREIAWVKTTNQPYLVIESTVNELETRKAAIFDGATDLISL